MRLIEDHELDAVTGAYTQQELAEFLERVLRNMQPSPTPEPVVW